MKLNKVETEMLTLNTSRYSQNTLTKAIEQQGVDAERGGRGGGKTEEAEGGGQEEG